MVAIPLAKGVVELQQTYSTYPKQTPINLISSFGIKGCHNCSLPRCLGYPLGKWTVEERFDVFKPRLLRIQTDICAHSKVEPNIKLKFSFLRLNEATIAESRMTPELQALEKWASEIDTIPNLLIVGYSAWMLHSSTEARIPAYEALDLLRDAHKLMIPLLEKISQKARVLILPQSRIRRVNDIHYIVRNSVMTDALFDWNEAIFLHELQAHRKTQTRLNNKLKSEGRRQTQISDLSQRHKGAENKMSTTIEDGTEQIHINHFQKHTSQYKSRFSAKKNGVTLHSDKTKIPKESVLDSQKHQMSIQDVSPDHLRPQSIEDYGLWWWDSTLPFNLASTSECYQLEFRIRSHPLYKDLVLRCSDDQHAGTTTYDDWVTMLLNLICNSELGLQREFCCS
ncbi:hypothetical protein SK128_006378 [Halocaridina rubra]|uniref:Uncharacterized protein n=1 Tax=Halocaridina rubra TaxID=373956 RepID=A0AAN9A399_HALRR